MDYLKPSLSYEDQADRLLRRGLVADCDSLIEHLQDVNYYRLSGYWYPFLDNDKFRDGTTFDSIWRMYTFDRRFRLIVLDAIERIEVYVRSKLAYELSMAQGPFGFQEKTNLPNLNCKEYGDFITKADASYRNSKELFARHFGKEYGDVHDLPPYWVLVEMFDFGQTYKLFKGAPKNVQKIVASSLGIGIPVLDSWLLTLNSIRNACAHHARLWNKVIGFKPKIPRKGTMWVELEGNNDRLYAVLMTMSYLLHIIAPQTKWRSRLDSLFNEYPEVDKRNMGFPAAWEISALWTLNQQ